VYKRRNEIRQADVEKERKKRGKREEKERKKRDNKNRAQNMGDSKIE